MTGLFLVPKAQSVTQSLTPGREGAFLKDARFEWIDFRRGGQSTHTTDSIIGKSSLACPPDMEDPPIFVWSDFGVF